MSDCRVKPTVNQILLYISNIDMTLINYSRDPGILVEAYSPITHGEALKNPAIVDLHPLCRPAWEPLRCLKPPILTHMVSNAALDFVISEADMKALQQMDRITNHGEFDIFPIFSGKPLA